MIVALALFFSSIRRFKSAGTPVPGNKPTTAIVRSGPYRFSRNPIYLAFSLLVLGIACAFNSLWLLGTLAAAVSVMSFVVIPREERYLERRFGAEYPDYKAKVDAGSSHGTAHGTMLLIGSRRQGPPANRARRTERQEAKNQDKPAVFMTLTTRSSLNRM